MSDDEECGDPMDYYEEYSEWLMQKDRAADLMICNGHDLVRHLEAGTGFDEFLADKLERRL